MPQNEEKHLEIAELIGETTSYDKKQALEEKRPKSWCKSVCAFANGEGGALVFGIADDGTVVGLDNPEQDACGQDQRDHQIASGPDPGVSASF